MRLHSRSRYAAFISALAFEWSSFNASLRVIREACEPHQSPQPKRDLAIVFIDRPIRRHHRIVIMEAAAISMS